MAVTAPASGPDPDREPPVTGEDLAAYMGATPVESMDRAVAAAVQIVEGRCGPIKPTEWTYLVAQDPSGALFVPSGPVASLDALVDPAGVDHVDSVSAEDVDFLDGIVWPPVRRRGRWVVTVTTARPTGVDDLVEAACVIAKQLWTPRRGEDVRPNVGMQPPGYGGSTYVPVPAGFAVPHRAVELMADHLLPMAG